MRRVTLRDGQTARVRPIRPEDEPELSALYARLSPNSAYQRFFTILARLPPDWAHFLANVDYDRRMAIVALDQHDRLIAVTRYDYDPAASEAEIAIVVQDAWQGKGLGTILLGALLECAQARDIRRFRAHVLTDNDRMLRMLARFGRVLERRTEHGVTSLLLAPPSRSESRA